MISKQVPSGISQGAPLGIRPGIPSENTTGVSSVVYPGVPSNFKHGFPSGIPPVNLPSKSFFKEFSLCTFMDFCRNSLRCFKGSVQEFLKRYVQELFLQKFSRCTLFQGYLQKFHQVSFQEFLQKFLKNILQSLIHKFFQRFPNKFHLGILTGVHSGNTLGVLPTYFLHGFLQQFLQ